MGAQSGTSLLGGDDGESSGPVSALVGPVRVRL